MKVQAPFGFVTGCHAGDKFMVGATLASMRFYCPRTPICLIVDGNFDVTDLQTRYDLIVLRVPDLKNKEMRQLISGNYRAKLAAMWEGPFEFYVWMDSDAIVWGDFTSQVRADLDFHIFWQEAEQQIMPPDPNGFKHYYFDPEKLRQFDPRFEWKGNTYFSAGAYACRRGVITFQEWLQTEAWNDQTPGGLFRFGDMGLLNYLVHAKAQRKEITVTSSDLQHVWAHHGKLELMRDCLASGWRFPRTIQRPRVAHFCGRKPFMFDRESYSRPFTIARLEHHRRKKIELGAWLAVILEDSQILNRKLKSRLMRLCNQPSQRAHEKE